MDAKPKPRRWRMHAGALEPPIDGQRFMDFGEPWYVREHEHVPIAVELTEDPAGTYWGWVDVKGDGEPEMIQPHYGMFAMQFAYGPEIEQRHRKGEIVRLAVRELPS